MPKVDSRCRTRPVTLSRRDAALLRRDKLIELFQLGGVRAAKFARYMGVPGQTLHSWLRGSCTTPHAAVTAAKWACAMLGRTVDTRIRPGRVSRRYGRTQGAHMPAGSAPWGRERGALDLTETNLADDLRRIARSGLRIK